MDSLDLLKILVSITDTIDLKDLLNIDGLDSWYLILLKFIVPMISKE